MILWNYIREHMLRYPAQTVEEGNASMTYEELVIYAESFQKKLSGETCCAICCHSEMAAAMALLGCFAAGVTAVPLSVRYGRIYLRRLLESFSPSCLITDAEGELQIYHIADSESFLLGPPPALIMWTSGTTGKPKGAMLSERNVTTNLQDISYYFSLQPADSILIFRPLYHCAVLTGEFLTALVKGTKVVFYSEAFNPQILVGLLKSREITTLGGTPTLLSILLHFLRGGHEFSLKNIVISGECMSEAMGKRLRRIIPEGDFYHVYGLTEACPRVSYMPPEHFDEAPDCVGIPLPSVKIEIRDSAGVPVKNGEKGILWVQGESVMQGYYNAPEETDRILQKGWLCTGDIACIQADHWLKIIGRSDDMVIRAGMNIYPQEVEGAIRKDPRTDEVLVYGYKDPRYGTQLAMKISGDFQTEGEVRRMCVERLPSFQVPMKIEIVEELPINGSGKIIRGKAE